MNIHDANVAITTLSLLQLMLRYCHHFHDTDEHYHYGHWCYDHTVAMMLMLLWYFCLYCRCCHDAAATMLSLLLWCVRHCNTELSSPLSLLQYSDADSLLPLTLLPLPRRCQRHLWDKAHDVLLAKTSLISYCRRNHHLLKKKLYE